MTSQASAVGSAGVVIVATRGASGPGEVLLSLNGGTETYLAWSDQPLAKGTRVIAIERRGARTVQVVPADEL